MFFRIAQYHCTCVRCAERFSSATASALLTLYRFKMYEMGV